MSAGGDPGRTKAMLAILGVLVAIYFFYNNPFGEDAAAKARANALAGLDERLRAILALDPPREAVAEAMMDYEHRRNLFEYAPSPEELARRLKQEEDRQKRIEAERNRPKPPPRVQRRQAKVDRPPPAATPPAFSYSYIGRMGPVGHPEKQIAVLTKTGKSDGETYLAQVGEVLDEKFVIRGFDLDELTIGYTDPRFSERTQKIKMPQPKKKR